MASLTFKPWDPSQLRKANSKPVPAASTRKQQKPHDIAAPRPNGDDKDRPCPTVQQTFDFGEKSLDLDDKNDVEDRTMVYPLLDHLAGSLGAQDDEPLRMRDGALVVAQSSGHWQFAPETEHELQPQAGTPSTAQLPLPTSSLGEEDMVQSCVALWSDARPIQVMGNNGGKEPYDPGTGWREGAEQRVITESTSTLADTPPFPTGDASDPLLDAGLASAPSLGSPAVPDTPHLSPPYLSSPCMEASDTDTNPIREDEERPDNDFPFGRSNTDCQDEDRSKSARLAKPSSALAGTQEMAASRRYHRPTHTTSPPGAGKSSSVDSEPSGKPWPRPEVAPPHSMQANGRRTSFDRHRGRKRIRSVEGRLQTRQLSDIDKDSSLERAAKRRRFAVESQTTTVRRSSRLWRGPKQQHRKVLAASGPKTTMLGVRVRGGAPTDPKDVEGAASSSPAKEHAGQASRCHACGLSPPLLLRVAKKALAFGGLGGLLEGPESELLPSQLALLVVRSCLSLIENHISEGTGSEVIPRASSNRVESESDNQSGLASDDESAEDRDSDGALTEGGLSSDEAGSDDDQRGQRRRWSPLDEVRLTAYMKENLPMPSIATKLNRSKSAIAQHWRIMSAPQAGRGVPSPSRGGAVEVRHHTGLKTANRSRSEALQPSYNPQTLSVVDEGEWEVEEICGHRRLVDGSLKLYVKWKGGDKTWEPYKNVADTKALDAYEHLHGPVTVDTIDTA